MTEMWKRIPNTDYEVSSSGKVRSIDRCIKMADGRNRMCKGKELKGRDIKGYLCVQLGRKNGKPIHRLVAENFLDNPKNFKCINHKDGNKKNNDVQNLEWCSHSYNLIHAYEHKLNHRPKEIAQLSLDGKEIKRWKSAMECERVSGFNHRKISKCCNGKAKTHLGYRWVFV